MKETRLAMARQIKLSAQEHMLHGETLEQKWEFAQSVGFDGIELLGGGGGRCGVGGLVLLALALATLGLGLLRLVRLAGRTDPVSAANRVTGSVQNLYASHPSPSPSDASPA